jgi:carbon monoxide dehydrogenase subunit G
MTPMAAPIEPLTGEETFAATPAEVFALLVDLEAIAATLPGVSSRQRADDGTVRCDVRPGLSFLGGTIHVSLRIADAVAPSRALLRSSVRGIGMSMEVESQITVEEDPSAPGTAVATRVAWEARVTERRGLVAAVSPGLLRAAAQRLIAAGFEALRRRLEPDRS